MDEFNCRTLPILYNINVGHAKTTGILPFGSKVGIDFGKKKIILKESSVKSLNNYKKL